MKIKPKLDTERMQGLGPYKIDSFEVNYLYGLNDLCEKFIKEDFIILELGSNDGVSTSLFSFFAKKVISVDITKTEKIKKIIDSNNNIYFNQMTFEDFLKIDNNTYDLIYIDGNHDYYNVNLDIENFKNKVKKGGFLSGHDYNSITDGVVNAVKKHFSDKEIFIFSDSSWLVKLD